MKQNAITVSSEVLGGIPVFKGTRVPVQNLFDYIEGGYTIDQFLSGFPSVRKEQALEVLHMAEITKNSH
jgi:uncharacterized protein (DUF433 family)